MAFYGDLSKYYEAIFPLNEDRLKLVERYLEPNSRILDIGCSTGELAISLAKLGYTVCGIDLSEAMIARARENARQEMVNVDFQVADMCKITNLNLGNFSCILCLGNTLVHLTSMSQLRICLEQVYASLAKGGVFIFQIVNYDRVLYHDIRELPVITNKEQGVTFYRSYDYDAKNNLIHFNTRLLAGGEEEVHHSVELYPLTQNEIRLMLGACGFREPHFYGNFTEAPFEPDSSPALVVVVRK